MATKRTTAKKPPAKRTPRASKARAAPAQLSDGPGTRTPAQPSRGRGDVTSGAPPTATGDGTPSPASVLSYVEKALAYARAVVAGEIPACKYVKQSCKRQLDDLANRDTKGVLRGTFVWDEEKANRVCRFIERLPHVKGPKAKGNELIKLEGWQCFILTTVFGWRRTDTGGRRFKRAYTEVPRGNAKSTLSSGVGLYGLAADDEEGPEVYSAATTQDQARIVQGDAQAMMRKRPEFADKLGIQVNKYDMECRRNNGKFQALTREHKSLDGKNVHIAVIDELHAHKDRGVYDVIETGAGKRLSSLIWVITTAGSDTAGICYEVRSYVVKILSGVVEDDSQFGIIYTLDDEDDWTDPKNWAKANPNWGVSVMPDVFAASAKKAMAVLSAQNNFKTKHLNLWVNADVLWMDMRSWDRCADLDMKLEDFTSEGLWDGLDLATKTDIASKARLFKKYLPKYVARVESLPEDAPRVCAEHKEPGHFDCPVCYPRREDGTPLELEAHYYSFTVNYLPEAAIHDGRNSQYEGWALEGWLTETPGDVLDFGLVKAEVKADQDQFNLREVAYDPWQSTQLAQECQDQYGIEMIEIRQTVNTLSAPMKEMEALVLARLWHHDGSPVMRWMVSNVVAHRDVKDNIYPRKERPENKIDGVVANIMALARAILDNDPYAGAQGFKTL